MERTLRELYLNLLIKTLANLIYEDPSITPGSEARFDATLRVEGRDWPESAHTMAGVKRLESLRALTQRTLDESIPGDFIETGVWRGGCCILMRGVLAANLISDRRIYVADSFAGLPPADAAAYPADRGFDLDRYPQLAVPLEEVRKNFARYDLLDEQVVFIKGFFSETLPTLQAGPFALLRLDGDLYESTYVALQALYPKLSHRGFVIVDDFNAFPPCKQAVLDYRHEMKIDCPMHEIDWTAYWWRKE
jgi:O-methyltransferase/8-demethyl-8-(2,3-dimethoxy-alpha-L-rhamnosyl)tetracenomycin-C 4'-O-methyltransferase